jgi:hypothetical protein
MCIRDMVATKSKVDTMNHPSLTDTIEVVRSLQQSALLTEARLKNLEEASKTIGDAQHKMDEKFDSIHRMITQ